MTKVYRNKHGQPCGQLSSDNKYRKKVQESKHLFVSGDAWGIDSDIVFDLNSNGCTEVRVWDTEKNVIYSIPMKEWNRKSWELDMGHGAQQFVARKEWSKKEVK